MQKITTDDIRRSFINASRSEVKAISFPADFEERDWDNLDYLGWRDSKLPQRGYRIYPGPKGLVGLLLRAPQAGGKQRKVLCELCRDVRCEAEVLLYVARRAGAAGRAGNTVGTLICAEFQCSANARVEVPESRRYLDPETLRERQTAGLLERIGEFPDRVRA